MADEPGKRDGVAVKEEVTRRGRGRPRKEGKDKDQAEQMKNFLAQGSCGFNVTFGDKRRVEHSPVKNNKDNEKREKELKDDEIEKENENEEEEAGTEEKPDDENNKEEEVKAAGATASGKDSDEEERKESALPTERDARAGREAAAAAQANEGEEDDGTREGDTGQITSKETEEKALMIKVLKTLESKIDSLGKAKEQIEREMLLMRKELDREIERNCKLQGEIEKLKEWSYEDDERIEKLEKELEKVINRDRIITEERIEGREREDERNDNRIDKEIEKETDKEGEGAGTRQWEGDEDLNNNGKAVDREYSKVIPEKLSEEELEWEMAERRSRKKNIFIRGIRTVGTKIKEEIKGIIKEKLNEAIYIKRTRAIGGGLVVELESMENKIEIMRKRRMLQGVNLWLEDDLTEREKEIKKWLEMVAKEERELGTEAQLGYQKIKLQGIWFEWDEKVGKTVSMEEKLFRDKKEERRRS